MKQSIVWLCLTFFILMAVGFISYRYYISTQANNSSYAVPTSSQAIITVGWKVLKNKFGWSIQYPQDWSASGLAEDEGVDPSQLDTVSIAGPNHASTGAMGYLEISANTGYPFSVRTASPQEFFKESLPEPNPDIALLDQGPIVINGLSAYQITELRKNEYPHGQIYREVAIQYKNSIFTILYMESNNSAKPLPTNQWTLMPLFNTIISTFHF